MEEYLSKETAENEIVGDTQNQMPCLPKVTNVTSKCLHLEFCSIYSNIVGILLYFYTTREQLRYRLPPLLPALHSCCSFHQNHDEIWEDA